MKKSKENNHKKNGKNENATKKYSPNNQGIEEVDSPKDVDQAAAEVNRNWDKLKDKTSK